MTNTAHTDKQQQRLPGLLEIALEYRSLQGRYAQASRSPQLRQELRPQIARAGQQGDEAAEALRLWLEDDRNTQSKYRPAAQKLYEAWTQARRAFFAWADTHSPEKLAALRSAETQLSQTLRDTTKKIDLL